MPTRDYGLPAAAVNASGDREHRMRLVVDALWTLLHDKGCSWIGFYLKTDGEELVLGPRRDKPACSPIGLHGACGRCWLLRRPLLVTDVAKLGAGYIACDPRDRSEAVIPCIDEHSVCWGVLDADSFDLAAFDQSDVSGMVAVLRKAGLFHGSLPPTEIV